MKMNWPESLKQRIVTELKGYDVYFSPGDVPVDIDFPKQWRGFGLTNSGKNIFLRNGLSFPNFCLG